MSTRPAVSQVAIDLKQITGDDYVPHPPIKCTHKEPLHDARDFDICVCGHA